MPNPKQSPYTMRNKTMYSTPSQSTGRRRERPTPNPNPGRPARFRLLALALLALAVVGGAAPLHATPVISGDVDQIVTVTPADCPGCTASEVDKLERGVGMMLTEMRQSAVDGEVCVAQAALARDMAVLTFGAHRAGAITEIRWRDALRAKGRFAGALTDLTIDSMLRFFRGRIEERFDLVIEPGSAWELAVDIWASAQLARIFDAMDQGLWHDAWPAILNQPPVGVNPVIEILLGLDWEHRQIWNNILMYNRPYNLWQDNELARLGQLKDDFLVGTIEDDRNQLVTAYGDAMSAEPWVVMAFECGASAAAGFRQHAIELSESVVSIYLRTEKRNGPFHQIDPFGGVVFITIDRSLRDRIDPIPTDPPASPNYCRIQTEAWAARLDLGLCEPPPERYFDSCTAPAELRQQFQEICGGEPNPNPTPPTPPTPPGPPGPPGTPVPGPPNPGPGQCVYGCGPWTDGPFHQIPN